MLNRRRMAGGLFAAFQATLPRRRWPRGRQVIALSAVLLAAGVYPLPSARLAATPAPWGQRGAARRQAQRARQAHAAAARDNHQHPPGFFQHLRDLPPEQQDRILANDQRFRQLPPQRQQQIRENLRRWNALTPQQKQIMRQRQAILQSMTPEQRHQLQNIFPHYRQLPDNRKRAVLNAFQRMRDMTPAQRHRFLSSPNVQQRFSPQEQQLLHQLNGVLGR